MMRNIPFPFLMKETLESIPQRAQRKSESVTAEAGAAFAASHGSALA